MPTFNWTPNYNANKSPKARVIECKFDDGYEQTQAVGINSQSQDWSLTFENRSTAEADAIDAFLTARGMTESFDWTPPGGSAGKYKCRKWNRRRIKANLYSFSAEFNQVFEP